MINEIQLLKKTNNELEIQNREALPSIQCHKERVQMIRKLKS